MMTTDDELLAKTNGDYIDDLTDDELLRLTVLEKQASQKDFFSMRDSQYVKHRNIQIAKILGLVILTNILSVILTISVVSS
jgi:hypothetical protein